MMKSELRDLLDKVESVPDFVGINLIDINDTNSFGDNALHCVCVWGDLDAVQLLVENGIDIEQRGEGGFTPLRIAHDFGHQEVVDYLISKGAVPNALLANFEFDAGANAAHHKKLQAGIDDLEEIVKSGCDG